jgi:hypothetical protein
MADDSDTSDGTDPAVEAEEASSRGAESEEATDDAENPVPDAEDAAPNGNGDETTPRVELDMYQLSVRVTGRSDDELDAVASSARGLMDYLIEQSERLEDEPDSRGLG